MDRNRVAQLAFRLEELAGELHMAAELMPEGLVRQTASDIDNTTRKVLEALEVDGGNPGPQVKKD